MRRRAARARVERMTRNMVLVSCGVGGTVRTLGSEDDGRSVVSQDGDLRYLKNQREVPFCEFERRKVISTAKRLLKDGRFGTPAGSLQNCCALAPLPDDAPSFVSRDPSLHLH